MNWETTIWISHSLHSWCLNHPWTWVQFTPAMPYSPAIPALSAAVIWVRLKPEAAPISSQSSTTSYELVWISHQWSSTAIPTPLLRVSWSTALSLLGCDLPSLPQSNFPWHSWCPRGIDRWLSSILGTVVHPQLATPNAPWYTVIPTFI